MAFSCWPRVMTTARPGPSHAWSSTRPIHRTRRNVARWWEIFGLIPTANSGSSSIKVSAISTGVMAIGASPAKIPMPMSRSGRSPLLRTTCAVNDQHNGEWLLPVSLWTRDRIKPASLAEAHHELDAIRMANVFASTDQGKTWTRRGGVAFLETDFDEHMIVEIARTGRLWMLKRTEEESVESFSASRDVIMEQDLGRRRFRIRVPGSSCAASLPETSTGRTERPGRSAVARVARVSRRFSPRADGGTWSRSAAIGDRALVSYPELDCRRPMCAYLTSSTTGIGTRTPRVLPGEVFAEEDFVLARKFQSPGAKARILAQ